MFSRPDDREARCCEAWESCREEAAVNCVLFSFINSFWGGCGRLRVCALTCIDPTKGVKVWEKGL